MRNAKSICSLMIAGCVAATALVSAPAPAQARDGRNAALFGGLAAGALLGGAIAGSSRAYGAAPVYGYETYEEPVEVRRCWRERQAVYDSWGEFAGYRRVRVCD